MNAARLATRYIEGGRGEGRYSTARITQDNAVGEWRFGGISPIPPPATRNVLGEIAATKGGIHDLWGRQMGQLEDIDGITMALESGGNHAQITRESRGTDR